MPEKYRQGIVVLVAFLALSAVGLLATTATGATRAPGTAKLDTIRIAISPYVDESMIEVGIKKGFFTKLGIDLKVSQTDWAPGQELLLGGHLDVTGACEGDVMTMDVQNNQYTLAFPFYWFAGSALMYNPNRYPQWKTYSQFLAQTHNKHTALRMALLQLKGKKIGLSAAGGAELATLTGMANYASLPMSTFTTIDLQQANMPAALVAGSIDTFVSDVPSRIAVARRGYKALVEQTTLPWTIAHCGYAARRDWVDSHLDLAKRFQEGIFQTVTYITNNNTAAFPILSAALLKGGNKITPADLKNVWNTMEIFGGSKGWFDSNVVSPKGQFYWKKRLTTVYGQIQKSGKSIKNLTSLNSLYYGLKIVASTP